MAYKTAAVTICLCVANCSYGEFQSVAWNARVVTQIDETASSVLGNTCQINLFGIDPGQNTPLITELEPCGVSSESEFMIENPDNHWFEVRDTAQINHGMGLGSGNPYFSQRVSAVGEFFDYSARVGFNFNSFARNYVGAGKMEATATLTAIFDTSQLRQPDAQSYSLWLHGGQPNGIADFTATAHVYDDTTDELLLSWESAGANPPSNPLGLFRQKIDVGDRLGNDIRFEFSGTGEMTATEMDQIGLLVRTDFVVVVPEPKSIPLLFSMALLAGLRSLAGSRSPRTASPFPSQPRAL